MAKDNCSFKRELLISISVALLAWSVKQLLAPPPAQNTEQTQYLV